MNRHRPPPVDREAPERAELLRHLAALVAAPGQLERAAMVPIPDIDELVRWWSSLLPITRAAILDEPEEELRAIYPHRADGRIDERVGDGFVGRLVDEVTAGFRGDVGVVPRQFLRTFVDQLDLVAQERDYVPAEAFQFAATALTPEERHAITGEPLPEVVEPEEGVGVMKW